MNPTRRLLNFSYLTEVIEEILVINPYNKIKNPLTSKKSAKMTVDGKTVHGVDENSKDRNNFKNKYGISKNDLSKKEHDFIKIYTGEGYFPLNEYIRKNINKKICEYEWNKASKLLFGEVAVSFDEALKLRKNIFKKAITLEKDLIVIRKEKTSALIKYSQKGIYVSDTLLSVSISKNLDENKYGKNVNYILLPKGTKILYIEKISSTKEEFEILLECGTKLRKIRKTGKYLYH
ncbi:ADP-ribosyltransferase [Methanobrevibacter sp. DSM 116169]|uniref:ADP-ribosyltransferase n=1 Tax=Methanobrevibacter sp. DSM 116169 TaxID=3242727 RepID=UPI0038FBFDD3